MVQGSERGVGICFLGSGAGWSVVFQRHVELAFRVVVSESHSTLPPCPLRASPGTLSLAPPPACRLLTLRAQAAQSENHLLFPLRLLSDLTLGD